MNRHKLFDQARGVAIIAMVMANSASLFGEEVKVGFWFRLLASFPAPIFVVLAGLMVALTAPKHNFTYFVWRGMFVVGMGVIVDVVANLVVPFQSCDVLYLMGFMMPCAYVANRLKTPQLLSFIIALLVLSFAALLALSYQPLPLMTFFNGEVLPKGASPVVWRHWLVDGWFPLLPWLPIGLSGILFARYYQRSIKQGGFGFARTSFLVGAFVLVLLGMVVSWLDPSPFLIRDGYVELFYPPNCAFVLSALGVVALVLVMSELSSLWTSLKWFQLFGSMTLAMYLLHLLIIGHILENLFYPIPSMASFFAIYAGHLVVLTLGAYLIKFARDSYTDMPLMMRWLLGK